MNLGLGGRTAIVCGASSGLGLATAEALAQEGANVAMFARRRELLEREADRIGARHASGLAEATRSGADVVSARAAPERARVLAVGGDVTSRRDLERLVERTLDAFGGIDILVWNGGGPPPGTAVDIADDALEQAFELLLVPPVRLLRLCLPHLERSGHGRVLVFTSAAAREPTPHLALSNTLRPAVTGWAKSLARELGPRGITVNCVAPGRIDTPRLAHLYPGGPTDADLADIPLRRWGTPAEFAAVACFLASDGASYVSGAVVPVDGGLVRGLF